MSKSIPVVYSQTYQTPIGPVTIEADETAITGIKTVPDFFQEQEGVLSQETALIRRAYEELMGYFSGKRQSFDLPLHVSGTDFQMQVWKALQEIPYGETRTYKEIAIKTGRPKACRAVGGACHRNPIFIMIPCHRVIGSDGSLTGFGGGLPAKQRLLLLEQNHRVTI